MKKKPAAPNPVEDRMMRSKPARVCPSCKGTRSIVQSNCTGLVETVNCRRCKGSGWALLLFLSCILHFASSPAHAATVTGLLSTASSNPYATNLLFTPISTPLVNGNLLIGSAPSNVLASAAGVFSVDLKAGDYRVNVGELKRDTFIISVPTNVATYNIVSLITNALTYTFNASPNYELVINKGVTNGYASLGSDGLVPSSQLPAGNGGSTLQTNANQFGAAGATLTIKDGVRLTNINFVVFTVGLGDGFFSISNLFEGVRALQINPDGGQLTYYSDASFAGTVTAPNLPVIAGANRVIAENGAANARATKTFIGTNGITIHHTDTTIIASNSSAGATQFVTATFGSIYFTNSLSLSNFAIGSGNGILQISNRSTEVLPLFIDWDDDEVHIATLTVGTLTANVLSYFSGGLIGTTVSASGGVNTKELVITNTAYLAARGAGKLLRTDSATNIAEVTIGAGVAFDGTTLSAAGAVQTNASQFGAAGATLTIKQGASLTNSFFYPASSSGRALTIQGEIGQDGDLQQWKDYTGATLSLVQYDGQFSGPNIPVLGGANSIVAENGANTARVTKALTGSGGLVVHHTDGGIVVSNATAASFTGTTNYLPLRPTSFIPAATNFAYADETLQTSFLSFPHTNGVGTVIALSATADQLWLPNDYATNTLALELGGILTATNGPNASNAIFQATILRHNHTGQTSTNDAMVGPFDAGSSTLTMAVTASHTGTNKVQMFSATITNCTLAAGETFTLKLERLNANAADLIGAGVVGITSARLRYTRP